MPKLFFGKFTYEDQYSDKVFRLPKGPQAEQEKWLNGLSAGDYVFPSHKGVISELWKVSYIDLAGHQVIFESIRQFAPQRLSKEFLMYKYLQLNQASLNSYAKWTKGVAFFPVTLEIGHPDYTAISFSDKRSIKICNKGYNGIPSDREIRILVENGRIEDMQIYIDGEFQRYTPLSDIYLNKNPQQYSLTELLDYAKEDNAGFKEKYLEALIEALDKNNVYNVLNPMALYDNLLVGRLVTKKKEQTPRSPLSIVWDDANEPSAEDYQAFEDYARVLDFNPNIILHGPPGTGKTYSAKNIIRAYDAMQDRRDWPPLEERMEFISFHQSYSYEDFIEGLRPETTNDDKLKYSVKDGLLKRLALRARKTRIADDTSNDAVNEVNLEGKVWKVSLGGADNKKLRQECIENNRIEVGGLKTDISGMTKDEILTALRQAGGSEYSNNPTVNADSLYSFAERMQVGDLVFILNTKSTIAAVGVITGEYSYKSDNVYGHIRDVKWLEVFDEPRNIMALNDNVALTLQMVYHLSRISPQNALTVLTNKAERNIRSAPYYLIIDEINRANVSKVFGEIFTLVEKDKREETKCRLPYSGDTFTLPKNIYIIGTMNTTDRSIALMDVALRRRFAFIDIAPDSGIIDAVPHDTGNIDLKKLMEALNVIISEELGRDYAIGHSYFLNHNSISQIRYMWYYSIIPLLTEYFYDSGRLQKIIPSFYDGRQVIRFNDDEQFINALEKIYGAGS